MQFVFGAGDFFGVPLLDASGNSITNPTPVKIGAMQEMSLEFSGDVKEAYGQLQSPIVIARGKTKISGKIKGLQVHGTMLNSLFFGQTLSSGTLSAAYSDTAGAAIPGTPYTITPTPPNSGAWQDDLGVLDSNGLPFTRVASAPATGQYSVAAGVYTFAAADTTRQVFINYRYTAALTGAKKISVTNLPMGAAPTFKAYLNTSFNGKRALAVLYSCVAPKLHLLGTKLDDFSMPELDFSAMADSANNVADIWVQE